jgi:hypothetical protein
MSEDEEEMRTRHSEDDVQMLDEPSNDRGDAPEPIRSHQQRLSPPPSASSHIPPAAASVSRKRNHSTVSSDAYGTTDESFYKDDSSSDVIQTKISVPKAAVRSEEKKFVMLNTNNTLAQKLQAIAKQGASVKGLGIEEN